MRYLDFVPLLPNNSNKVVVPFRKKYNQRYFTYSDATLWNSLPANIREQEDILNSQALCDWSKNNSKKWRVLTLCDSIHLNDVVLRCIYI